VASRQIPADEFSAGVISLAGHQTGNGGLHRRTCLSLEDEYFAHGVRPHQSWPQGGGGPLTQNHVTTPNIMITRHPTAIIPSRVTFRRTKTKDSCRCVPQESLVSPRETVHGGLHRPQLFFPSYTTSQAGQADVDHRAECSGSVAKAAQSAPLEPTIPR
jgi:hypothetical protein